MARFDVSDYMLQLRDSLVSRRLRSVLLWDLPSGRPRYTLRPVRLSLCLPYCSVSLPERNVKGKTLKRVYYSY